MLVTRRRLKGKPRPDIKNYIDPAPDVVVALTRATLGCAAGLLLRSQVTGIYAALTVGASAPALLASLGKTATITEVPATDVLPQRSTELPVTRPPFARRYWNSLTGAVSDVVTGNERARDGYTFRERYWASLTVSNLPPRPTQAMQDAWHSMPTTRFPDHSLTATVPKDAWFPLPPVPAIAGLRAGDDDDILASESLLDGVEFFVRAGHGDFARYRVEVVLRKNEELPAIVKIRYPIATGHRVLLVPVAGAPFGAAASQVELPGLEALTPWEASRPEQVADAIERPADVVVDSIRAAASEATRDAWRTVRDNAHDDLQAVIDRFLP